MSTCPEHTWRRGEGDAALVFDQIDAGAVHAQYDKLLDNVTGLSEVHATSTPPARKSSRAFPRAPDIQQPQPTPQP